MAVNVFMTISRLTIPYGINEITDAITATIAEQRLIGVPANVSLARRLDRTNPIHRDYSSRPK